MSAADKARGSAAVLNAFRRGAWASTGSGAGVGRGGGAQSGASLAAAVMHFQSTQTAGLKMAVSGHLPRPVTKRD
jgi:hypothetical protein